MEYPIQIDLRFNGNQIGAIGTDILAANEISSRSENENMRLVRVEDSDGHLVALELFFEQKRRTDIASLFIPPSSRPKSFEMLLVFQLPYGDGSGGGVPLGVFDDETLAKACAWDRTQAEPGAIISIMSIRLNKAIE